MVARREFGENGHLKWIVAAVGGGATLGAWLYTTLIGHHLVPMPPALVAEPVEDGASRSTSPATAHHGRVQSAREVSS